MQLSRRSAVGLVVMHAVAATGAARSQIQQQPKQTTPPASTLPDITGKSSMEDSATGPLSERMRISAERAHNDDRRRRMLADTDKLLALSAELKEFIEKSTKDQLSLDVIRKAAEIEKLARDVQQRMKN